MKEAFEVFLIDIQYLEAPIQHWGCEIRRSSPEREVSYTVPVK